MRIRVVYARGVYTVCEGMTCGQGVEVRIAVNSFKLTAASRRAPARGFLCQTGRVRVEIYTQQSS
jgi:hypothetical protein